MTKKIKATFPFNIKITRPKKNIGTNAAWNHMFLSTADFVGMVGDDYRIEPRAIEILFKAASRMDYAGAVTATIFKDKEIDIESLKQKRIESGIVVGRGHFALSLFHRDYLHLIPKIPKELFIFYGDNWFGYWLNFIGLPLYEVNAGISHFHKTDLKDKLDYRKISGKERQIWNQWKNNKIKLGGKTHGN